MALTQEFVDQAGSALAEHCPLVSQDADAIAEVKRKILSYDQTLGQAPSVEMVCRWARAQEQQLQAAVDAENSEHEAEQSRKNARKRQFRDWNSPSAHDKAALVQEFQQKRSTQERPILKPSTAYTPEQIERMSSEDYKRLVLNVEKGPLEDLNVSVPSDELRKAADRRVLRPPKKDTPLKKAMRRVVREGLSK
jgi:hypothetical protein